MTATLVEVGNEAPAVTNRAPKANSYAPALGRPLIHPDDLPLLPHSARGREILAAISSGYDPYAWAGARRTSAVAGAPLTAENGWTGLAVQTGRVRQEYNLSLQDLKSRIVAYEEMRRSEPAVAVIEEFSYALAHTDYWIEPGDDFQLARFVQWNLEEGLTSPFSETIRQAALAKLYGFSWHYKRYQDVTFEGRQWLGWRQFAPRSRSTVYEWQFQDDGGLAGLVQYGTNPRTGETGYVEYSIDDIVVWTFRPDDGDPEGIGLFRQMYRPYSQKDAFQEFAAIRIERSAMGVPIAYGPPGYGLEEETQVLSIMKNIRTAEDAGAAVPDGWRLELLDLGPADVPFETHIERQHQYMLQVGRKQYVGLGQGGDSGSLGQGKDASSMDAMGMEYDADWLCDTFNQYVLWPLVRLNKSGVQRKPRLVHGRVGVKDTQAYVRGVELMYRGSEQGIPEHIKQRIARLQGLPSADAAAAGTAPGGAPEETTRQPEAPTGA